MISANGMRKKQKGTRKSMRQLGVCLFDRARSEVGRSGILRVQNEKAETWQVPSRRCPAREGSGLSEGHVWYVVWGGRGGI